MFCCSACARKFRRGQDSKERAEKITEDTIRKRVEMRDLTSPEAEYLRPEEAARYLGIGLRTLYRYMSDGLRIFFMMRTAMAFRSMPTTWDETRFIDGFPGKYVVLARRQLSLPMLTNQTLDYYVDDQNGQPVKTTLKTDRKGRAEVLIQLIRMLWKMMLKGIMN